MIRLATISIFILCINVSTSLNAWNTSTKEKIDQLLINQYVALAYAIGGGGTYFAISDDLSKAEIEALRKCREGIENQNIYKLKGLPNCYDGYYYFNKQYYLNGKKVTKMNKHYKGQFEWYIRKNVLNNSEFAKKAKQEENKRNEEEKRIAEEKRKAKEAEEKRIAEEKRKAKEAEEKRIAEAKKKEEEAKQAQEEELYVIGSGTGFFVNKDGYIVTNEHVAGICQSLASYINGKTHLFRIIALDKRNDLALLRGEYRNKTYLNINILGAEFGEDIMAFGFPLAENLSSSVKLTRGIVSSLSGPENDISLIQIDAAIQPGNSGGPVLNYNGQVVGVASSGLNKIQMLLDEESPYIPENVNFAVSANTLTGFLRSNSITIFNESYDKKSSQELAKIGMPPTIQLHCLNTISAHKKLRKSENYNDVLLKKVVNLR